MEREKAAAEMGVRWPRILVLAAALFFLFNLADVISTWLVISSGKGVEANPIVLLQGGPFTPTALIMKLAVIPGAILGLAWLFARKWKAPKLAIATVLPSAIGLAAVTAHNLMIALAGKKPKPLKERKEVEA